MSATSDFIRKSFKENDDIRDAGLTTPEDIERYDNILYGTDESWQVLDVYRPKGRDGERLPVIVSVHGGGWVYGDKERYQYYCMDLARRGFAVVNFTYRLAPEYQFPSSLEDTNLVFSWVLDHGDEYGMDKENIFAVGDSAGAHTLGLYTAMTVNPEYASAYSFPIPRGLRLNAIVLNCGVGRIQLTDNPADNTSALMADYLPEKGSERELSLISLMDHVTREYPPVFIMTAVNDFIKMESLVTAQKLAEMDVPFTLKMYGDKDNRLSHVFHLDIRSKDARICNDEECDFLKKHCR